MNTESMEQKLFSWKNWDGDPTYMTFTEVTLKQKIGDFDIGYKFASATILFEKGILQLETADGNETEYELNYQVGKQVFPPFNLNITY